MVWAGIFAVLAVVHLAALPRLLSESFDVTAARLAGLAYGFLSIVNWRWRRSVLRLSGRPAGPGPSA